jgi:hypothetical protein
MGKLATAASDLYYIPSKYHGDELSGGRSLMFKKISPCSLLVGLLFEGGAWRCDKERSGNLQSSMCFLPSEGDKDLVWSIDLDSPRRWTGSMSYVICHTLAITVIIAMQLSWSGFHIHPMHLDTPLLPLGWLVPEIYNLQDQPDKST